VRYFLAGGVDREQRLMSPVSKEKGVALGVLSLWKILFSVAEYFDKMATRFDIRKIRKLAARERYAELYFYSRHAEQMIASNFPAARRYGRRLKKRVENLYASWFGTEKRTYIPETAFEV